MTGFDAGRVRVRLTLRGDVIAAVDVSCERPDVAAALAGRPADEAVALVPLIYSLCGQAQGIAARAALGAARGTALAAHVDPRVAAEAAREHAWKLLVDWPQQLGLAPDEALFVRVAKAVPGTGAALAAELRAQPLFAAMAAMLGPTGIDAVLAARIAVRRDELIALLTGGATLAGTVAAEPLGEGRGRATVETARGDLCHEIELEGEGGDHIAAYHIVAPTDRLFGPDGPLPGWLVGGKEVGAGDAPTEVPLGDTATRAIMALDPCVPWILEK
ncbi:MAG: hypothetical protein Q8O25_15110 [Sulfurisoma sp.]|nr:hypothetical protein [Sulfurisoma sp.]